MRLLVIGGTVFVGKHFVVSAVEAGHSVTVFHRGAHALDAPAAVEELLGDRDSSMDILAGRSWDAVIDTCGYLPRVVRRSATRLCDAVGQYLFVSTRSVYEDLTGHRNESSPRAKVPPAIVAEMDVWRPTADEYLPKLDWYGGLKALCEDVVTEVYAERALVVRPGLIVGPDDPTDRFTYWPHRIDRGGQVLAPGRPDRELSFVDVRDLVSFMLRLVEGKARGVFDVIGPSGWTMASVLETCRAVAGSDAAFTWVDESFLLEENVAPWTELPLWIEERDAPGLAAHNDRALAAGLVFRPLEVTTRDTLAWDRTRPENVERKNGMAPEREAELLRAWQGRSLRPQ